MLNDAANDLEDLIEELKEKLMLSSLNIEFDKNPKRFLENISDSLCKLAMRYREYCVKNGIEDDIQWKKFRKIFNVLQQNYDKIFLKDEQILKLKISKDETLQLAMFAKLNSYNMNVMKIIEFAIKVNKMRVFENKFEQICNDFSRKEAVFFSLSFALVNGIILSTMSKEKEISGMEILLYGFIIGAISTLFYILHRHTKYNWRDVLKNNSLQTPER